MRLLLAAVLAVSATLSQAATIVHDEAVDGDLNTRSVLGNTQLGTIPTTGFSIIRGSLDGGVDNTGSGPDENDRFEFTLLQTTAFSFQNIPGTALFAPIFSKLNGSSAPISTLRPPAQLDAGVWAFNLVPAGNQGTVGWEIQFGTAPVPLPASVLLYGSVLMGAGAIAVRRRRRG